MSLYKERQKHFHNSVFCEKLRNQKPCPGRNPSFLHSLGGKISNFHSDLPLAVTRSFAPWLLPHLRLLRTLRIGILDNANINFQVFKIFTSHGYKFSMLRPRACFHSLQMTWNIFKLSFSPPNYFGMAEVNWHKEFVNRKVNSETALFFLFVTTCSTTVATEVLSLSVPHFEPVKLRNKVILNLSDTFKQD